MKRLPKANSPSTEVASATYSKYIRCHSSQSLTMNYWDACGWLQPLTLLKETTIKRDAPQASSTSPLLDLVGLKQPGAVTSPVCAYLSIWKRIASLELGTSSNPSHQYKYSQLLPITPGDKYSSQYKAT